ncbi:hypothetical protein B0T25DRAFT_562775 [Lasiosphaeria hispida]|uniref:2EXR domain-containing protein n=1 Tax=Lasiosphaeria hispida TaxID=260671 RepID=A0AAJ0HW62_9PEZI|nr:hypothetical protein B0T25DRAFT_562775 [Lasiosphaeria hispida]
MNKTGNDGTPANGTLSNGGTPATRFHLFSKLPAELRLMIWTEALPSRFISADRTRSAIAGLLGGGTVHHNEEFMSFHCSGGICARNTRPPVIATVCREARQVALKTSVLCVVPSEQYSLGLHNASSYSWTWYDIRRDTLMLLDNFNPRCVSGPNGHIFVAGARSLQLLDQDQKPYNKAITELCKLGIQICVMAPTQPSWWRPQGRHDPVLLHKVPFTLPLGMANMFVDFLIRLREFKEFGMVTYQLTIHADDSFMDEHSHSLFGADFRECPQRLVAQDNTELINQFLALYLRTKPRRHRPELDIRKELQQARSLFLILEASLKVMWQDKPSTAWESETEHEWNADGDDNHMSGFPVDWRFPQTTGYLEVGKPIPVRDDIATPEALDHRLRFAEIYTSRGTNTDGNGNEYTVPRMPRLKPLILFRHCASQVGFGSSVGLR